ncbi:conserved hypothetical protein [Leishmania braziliensis MHOM/BR/75/M2904]|uniref:Uncharacterized protein n=2 Tax=Leishmania braziliensis TaxID=5660 RepID=A4H3A3_LEIBR|nr:conserved hypothetical protein [Leishmania braziliensis MHOM/BR/75/M2904]KAI5684852.1 hypothetical protein MNV84_00283 [Leishmania braziliensis]CAJ2465804.1 unnamed protein product [Leishmania braziliensis]CAJ2466246.1 unnamed protein product [Leishmania braziliensis]CAM41408.1 conserved hypothetical protein [Leishmania braziliensis MHOM/BR/75/M2904]SYZ62386.1 hypothetical_protein [Leishmania braziliensis MHOM/BR/75/M2904]
MLKKVLKIKGVEGRTALVEFAVNKRVKYLEYLKELHSEEGSLWMNTVHLDLYEIGKYFNVADACLPADRGGVSKAGLIRLPAEKPVAVAASTTGARPSLSSNASADPNVAEADFITVSIANAPAAIQQRSSSAEDWARYYLPCYVALAISLSEILLVPIGGEEFVECFYGLLLELEVAYASGAASKALAQRNLRQFRQHVSRGLKSLLQTSTDAEARDGVPTLPVTTTSSDLDAQVKYIFLNQRHLEYTAASPSYDAVIPALCSVLMFAYRKLCDYELMREEECVRRILSIDKRLERLFFAHVSHEVDKIANHKLLREAYLLSTGALFADLLAESAHRGASSDAAIGGGADFVTDLLMQHQEHRGSSSLKATGKKGFDSSSDEEDDGTVWFGPGVDQ